MCGHPLTQNATEGCSKPKEGCFSGHEHTSFLPLACRVEAGLDRGDGFVVRCFD
jgi:hypothetical protein